MPFVHEKLSPFHPPETQSLSVLLPEEANAKRANGALAFLPSGTALKLGGPPADAQAKVEISAIAAVIPVASAAPAVAGVQSANTSMNTALQQAILQQQQQGGGGQGGGAHGVRKNGLDAIGQ